MRKTLFIAVLSLGVSMAASAATVFTSNEDYSLSSRTAISNNSPGVVGELDLNSLVQVSGNDKSTGTGTIMMWVTLDSLPTGLTSLFSVHTNATSIGGWGVMVGNDGKLNICQQKTPSSNKITSNSTKTTADSPISAGTAFHLALSSVGGRETNSLVLYVNGKEVATCAGFGLDGNRFQDLLIGEINGNLSGTASGLTVDNTVLDASAIQAIMENTRPVPEPATASLGLLGLAVLMMRRRRA
ncbi:LamG-like jellyroll fold domain-containing protein [Akkermansia sp.]|uniref:LamG-like jellyroll fold domain-containing protein n=1 Tax=Akkermansia sp. TaxID=1872421 RepID=UPI0025C23500|nr:LamG-like jellyroll fold domain-containing protein [Akkermansia sp.]MCC8149618.1 hypothetical protein [Akkermansia sp.]